MNIRLVKLSNEYRRHLTEMMDEWTAMDERIVPYAIRKNDHHDFEYYLKNLEIKALILQSSNMKMLDQFQTFDAWKRL